MYRVVAKNAPIKLEIRNWGHTMSHSDKSTVTLSSEASSQPSRGRCTTIAHLEKNPNNHPQERLRHG